MICITMNLSLQCLGQSASAHLEHWLFAVIGVQENLVLLMYECIYRGLDIFIYYVVSQYFDCFYYWHVGLFNLVECANKRRVIALRPQD